MYNPINGNVKTINPLLNEALRNIKFQDRESNNDGS
jgi:hypothetical protein